MMKNSMKKRRFELNSREQQIMELLWANPEGLTSVDIFDQLTEELVNQTYAHRTINSLLDKELIIANGTVRYNKQYARRFITTMTREEFGAGLLLENGIGSSSISELAMSLVNQDSTPLNKEELIKELKVIIKKLGKE